MKQPDKSVEARFWSKVDKTPGQGPRGDCWLWIAGLTKGYGQFQLCGKPVKAHRVAYAFTHGETPDELVVRHACDEPRCCNPLHLLIGTVSDNNHDMVLRGRAATGDKHWTKKHPELVPRGAGHWATDPGNVINFRRGDSHWARTHPERLRLGEEHGNSKLTASRVRQIREAYARGGVTHKALAARFEVSRSQVGKIINRQVWKHVT